MEVTDEDLRFLAENYLKAATNMNTG